MTMSRLFACICNQPERLLTAIEPAREALVVAEPVHRWGLGYVHTGEVLLSRHPRPVRGSFDFFEALGNLESDYVIGFATGEDGLRGNANTQPYRYRQWMFAQESSIEGFEAVSGDIEAELPGFLRRNIKGKSPAEYVFHIFLAKLHERGQIADPNLDTQVTRATLLETLDEVGQKIAAANLNGDLGNLVVSNSRSMVAVRLAGPLFLRRLRHQEDPKRPDTEFRSVFLVGISDNPAEGFEELPPRSVLAIGRDISTDISSADLAADEA
jgi:glutamine amidotransferase